jgi:hypothetical protein
LINVMLALVIDPSRLILLVIGGFLVFIHRNK